MAYIANPSGIGVGKRYGTRVIGTVEGSFPSINSEFELKVCLNSKDTTGPHVIKIPPFTKIIGIIEATKEVWSAAKAISLKLNGLEVTNGSMVMGTALGQTGYTLTGTVANLQNATATVKDFTVTPPTDTQGRSEIIVQCVRI